MLPFGNAPALETSGGAAVRMFYYVLLAVASWPAWAAAQGSVTSGWNIPSFQPASPYAQPVYPPAQAGYVPAYSTSGYPQGAYAPHVYQQEVHAAPPGQGPVEYAPQAHGHDITYAQSGAYARPDCAPPCASPCGRCLHRSGVFGEFLYWQVSGADVSYAVPQDGIGRVGTVQIGDVGVLDYDYKPAFRVGFNLALDCNSSVAVAYTKFETNGNGNLSVGAPAVIQPLVMIPDTFNAGFTAQAASATSSLSMETIDLEYRALICSGPRYYLNYIMGGRYGTLDQDFAAIFPFAPPDGTTQVAAELDFEGAGIRLGLEGDHMVLPKLGISVYSKTMVSLLGGEFSGRYQQVNQFNGLEAVTAWEDARLVPMAEAEVGLRWANRKDTLWLSAGYNVGAWSNVVTTQEWINGVQSLNFVDISRDSYDSIRFDGLVARAELRL